MIWRTILCRWRINTSYNLGNHHCLRRLFRKQFLNVCISAVVKCKTGDREVPGSIPGRCNSFVYLFFCSFFFFFYKKTESKGIHILLDNMSSLKMRGLWHSQQSWTIPNEFHFIVSLYNHYLSHVMRKPVYAICKQQRRRSACASAQSDQRICCCIISLVSISKISSL